LSIFIIFYNSRLIILIIISDRILFGFSFLEIVIEYQYNSILDRIDLISIIIIIVINIEIFIV